MKPRARIILDIKQVLPLLAWLLVAGCNDDIPKGGGLEEKPESEFHSYGFNDDGLIERKRSPMATVDYDLTLMSVSGLVVCRGVALVQLFSDFSLEFQDSNVRCGSFTIDLDKLLAGGDFVGQAQRGSTASNGNLAEVLDGFSHDGYALHTSQLGEGVRFDPPRPLLLGPLIVDNERFKDYESTVKTKVTVNSNSLKAEDTGVVSLKVIDPSSSFQGTHVNKGFANTIHWRMEASGFQGIPPQFGLLLKRIDFWYSPRPIMIPKIEITFAPSSFITKEVDVDKQSVEELVGDVTVIIEVNNYALSGR